MDDLNNNPTPTPTPTQESTPEPIPAPTDSTVELKATLELLKESQAMNQKLMKELEEVKVANAKLAITQTIASPKVDAEELLNKMFK